MKKKKQIMLIASLILILVLMGISLFFFYLRVTDHTFRNSTTINGTNVGGLSVEEASDLLVKTFEGRHVSLTEDGQTVLDSTFGEIGYSLNSRRLQSELVEIRTEMESNPIRALFGERNFEVMCPVVVDENLLENKVTADELSVERIRPEDAYVTYDIEGAEVVPEVYGTWFADSDLQDLVMEEMNAKLAESITEDAKIAIPETIYIQPEVLRDDKAIKKKVKRYKKLMKETITYQFGPQTEVLDWSDIQKMAYMSGDEICVDREAVSDFVIYDLAANYNTIYRERVFQTSLGTSVTLPSNDYGYRIDQSGETDQLCADILGLKDVEREPVYEIAGYQRNGKDDLYGTYVEVSLTRQHLWFYVDGNLVVETDVVTGMPKDGRETTQGAFPIPYKASPFNLTGGGGSGASSWDVNVSYWMPFFEGQGLHDATWRSSFGGKIYQSNGSHGCVNLPLDAAGRIYEYMDSGMPIILYK